MKKTPGHIILHMCKLIAKYDIHNSWDMEGNQQNFLSFWTIFCSWTPQTPKIKILKKWKNHVEILSFYILQMCTINNNHMMNGSCNLRSDSEDCLSIWTIFCHFTHLTTQKIKILKKWNKGLGISSF